MAQHRTVTGLAAVLLAASGSVAASAEAASAEPAPAAAAIQPVVSPQSGPNVWLYTSPRAARGTTAVAGGATGAVAAAVPEPPSAPKGIGPARNATQMPFSLTDRLQMQVNIGSGNLMLTSTEMTLPTLSGSVTLGASFNSLLLGSSVPAGSMGPGWRTRSGADVRLFEATSDRSVTYVAADGAIGKFTVDGSGYRSPGDFKAKLVRDGSGWKLSDNSSGGKLFFNSDGVLDRTEDRNRTEGRAGNLVDYVYTGAQWTSVVSDKGVGSARTVSVSYTDRKVSKYRQAGSDGSSVREATYAYDSLGRLQTIQSTTPRKVMFEYDSAGDLTKITTKPDTFVLITYDGQHRVTSVKQITDNPTGQGVVTRFAYTTADKTDVADSRQDQSRPVTEVPHSSYTLNSDKRVTKATDPAGNERSREYTAFSDVKLSSAPEGGKVANTFDANAGESMTKSESPTGSSAQAAYANAASQTNPTANFQPSSSIDTQGNGSAYTYNGAGNRTSSKDALASEAKVDYNDDGTIKKSTNPGDGSNGSVYDYDANKLLTKVTPPTGNGLTVRSFTYDAFTRLKTATKGACTTTFEYSAEDRLMKTTYSGTGCPSTQEVVFDYGLTGNLISRADATGTTTFQYDQLNRLRIRTAPGAQPLRYLVDGVGNLTELTDGRGVTKYYYNSRNLLVRMDTAGGTRYNFLYDKNGNRTHTYFATNETNSAWALHTVTTYDSSDRPKRVTSTRNSASPAKVFDVTYCYAKFVSGQACSAEKADDTGIRQWQKDEIAGTTSQFTLDKGNRLTKATSWNGKTYEYEYDTNGNRKTVKVDAATTQTLTFNSANQVTTGGNTYDNRGNQTKLTAPALDPMGYNGADQMTSNRGTTTTNYTYAGTDQVEMTRSGDIALTYGTQDQYGMAWVQSWTKGVNPTVYVERDGVGGALGLRIGTTDYTFVLDGIGSTVAVIAANNTVAATYKYDPYGVLTSSSETGLPQTNILRYAGGIYDAASKLTKFGQRWYTAEQGRFTQQDSLNFIGNPSNGNRYAYAGDNPVNNTDPTGQSTQSLGFEICVKVCAGLGYEWDDEGGQGISGSIGTGAGASVSYEESSGNVENSAGVYGQCSVGMFSGTVSEDLEGNDEYGAGFGSSGGVGCSAGIEGTAAF